MIPFHLELKYAKTWRIRRWITDKKKAMEGARHRATGLSGMMLESLEREIAQARAELKRRTEQPQ